ncbi:hypothetical protein BX616_009038 [Lobosporangium transversale]|nr:hypothetical protein BX616_009038 [Lobosporangium transversale]
MTMTSAKEKLQAFRLVGSDRSSTPLSDTQYIEARFDQKEQHVKPLRIRADFDAILDVVIPFRANNPKKPDSDSTITQWGIKEEPAAAELNETTALGSVNLGNSGDRKSLKADNAVPSTETRLHSENIPSYEATISTDSTIEESAELMPAPLAGEVQLGKAVKGDATDEANLNLILKVNGNSQDHSRAFDWFFKRASSGTSYGAYNTVGYMYYHGIGVSQNYSSALNWFNKAVNQGDSISQSNLGCMYYHGVGVSQDYSKAYDWYLKAANLENAIAQINLGWMYFYGKGVEQDYSKAFDRCLKPANQGNTRAQSSLGYMYLEAKGDSQDYSKATYWLLKAANQGNANAQSNLGYMYSRGKGVPKNYPRAIDWYLKAANQGNVTAQCNLGYVYYHGIGTSQDHSKAFDWYTKAADQGCPDAQRAIGSMYRAGKGIPEDQVETEQ